MKISQNLRDKWCAALRSGQYKQGFNALIDGRGRVCALGVLALVQGFNLNALSRDERATSLLPEKVAAGLHPALQNTISRLNDDKRRSFDSIAHYIENNVPVRK